MKRVRSKDSNRLEYREDSEVTLHGAILLLISGPILYFMWVSKSSSNGFSSILYCILAIAGLSMIFIRHFRTLDNEQMLLTYGYRILGIGLSRNTLVLKHGCYIEVVRENRGKRRRHIVYPVRICARGQAVEVCCSDDEMESRRETELVSQFLSVPIRDGSIGETVLRQPEEVGTSIRERPQVSELILIPEKPPNAVSQVASSSDQLTIDIPAIRQRPERIVCLTFAVISFGAMALVDASFRVLVDFGPATYILTFVSAFVVGFIVQGISGWGTRWKILVDSRQIRVVCFGLFLQETRVIWLNAIEELRIALEDEDQDLDAVSDAKTPATLVAITRSGKVTLASGPSIRELEWIRKVVLRQISNVCVMPDNGSQVI